MEVPARSGSRKESKRHAAPEGRGGVALPVGIAALFLSVVLVQARGKLLWGDEFVTYWIGQQRSFRGIWGALAAGGDPNPPLMHVLNWAVTSAFGSSSVVIRLPSILGMALTFACLWVFLRRRFAPVYAAAGCLALMTTRGFDYAYDARSYSLMLGFAMAAVLAWAVSAEVVGGRRWLALTGLAVALAAGVSTNYYGVLAFFAVAAGEVWASFERRKWRTGPWSAMALGALPLVGYLPLIRHNVGEFGPHAWNKPRFSMVSDSFLVIVEGILWPVVGLAVFAFWRKRRHGRSAELGGLSAAEWAAVAGLVACPAIAFLIALAGAGMISPRCAIAVCLGVVIAGTALLARSASRKVAGLVVAFLCVWVVAREAACGYVLLHQRHAFQKLRDSVERAAAPGEPVVIGDSLVVMPLYWYGSAALREQIVFPVDFDAIHRSEADDSGEQNLWGGRGGVFPVHIDTPAALLNRREERVFVGASANWLAEEMRHDGYSLSEQQTNVPWDRLGGVFTPMAHEGSRIYIAAPKPRH